MLHRPLTLVAAAVLCVGALAPRADAHPSAFDTLTLDLLLDRGGLVLIDAAANHATYQEAPSPEQRATLAFAVLDALGVPRESLEVDSANSLLYHEVGFTIYLHQPFANTTVPGELRIDSRAFQEIAAGGVGRLKLDVCRVAWPDQTLALDADIPASAPDLSGAGAAGFDRRDCASWTLQPDDAPISLTAHTAAVSPEPVAPASVQLLCGSPTDFDPDWVPAGAIALPDGPLHARATGATDPSGRLVAETILLVKASTAIQLVVPRAWKGRLSVGGRNGDRATARVKIPSCQGRPGRYAWSAVGMSVGVDQSSCVPIIVKTAKHERTVHVGIGVPCASDGSR